MPLLHMKKSIVCDEYRTILVSVSNFVYNGHSVVHQDETSVFVREAKEASRLKEKENFTLRTTLNIVTMLRS